MESVQTFNSDGVGRTGLFEIIGLPATRPPGQEAKCKDGQDGNNRDTTNDPANDRSDWNVVYDMGLDRGGGGGYNRSNRRCRARRLITGSAPQGREDEEIIDNVRISAVGHRHSDVDYVSAVSERRCPKVQG